MASESSSPLKPSIEELLQTFSRGTQRQRRSLISSVEARRDEFINLGASLFDSFDQNGDDWSAGWILQVFQRHQPDVINIISPSDSGGWFSTPSAVGIDYALFQQHLLAERFEDADRFTSATLRKLAGKGAESRGYVYFSEVSSIPEVDLNTLDRLWKAYSQGKFGFSIQARMLDALNGRYDRLWPKIGWKKDGTWTRYPASFTWSLEAPEGHMPLINQLRGVRLMDAILKHPALVTRIG